VSGKSPAFQFYAAEYLADENVQLMTLEEEGCYIRMLAYCWREGSIPADHKLLSRLCKNACEEVLTNVERRFEKQGTRLIHLRLELERKKQKNFNKKQRLAGIASGKARRQKKLHNEPPFNQRSVLVATKTNSSSSSSGSLPSADFEGIPARVALTEREEFARAQFEIFWIPYPNKIDRDIAQQTFLALSPIDQSKAAECIGLWAACEQWQESRYIPSPVKFLKNRRWEVVPPKNGGSNDSRQPVSKERQRVERSQQAIKNALGHRSRLADALRGELPGGNNGGPSVALPGSAGGSSTQSPAQIVHASSKEIEVQANTSGSSRTGRDRT
jgi:uncharacterized protein YdaU (DUF1376 family)